MRVLVDSGILLRLLDRADPLNADIRDAVRRLKQRGDELVTAAQNIAEFWNVATRPPSARGGYGLSTAETEHRLRLIERLFSVVTETRLRTRSGATWCEPTLCKAFRSMTLAWLP